MSDNTPVLHNVGYIPRASITWQGFRTDANATATEHDTAWRLIKGSRVEDPDAEGRAHALVAEGRLSPVEVALKLLEAPSGHGHTGNAEARLLDHIRRRAGQIGLPAVVPCSAGEEHTKRTTDRGAPHIADVLTAVTLQSLCVGSLLVRDGEPRLSQVRAQCATDVKGRRIVVWPVCLWLPYKTVRRIETLYQETANHELG